MTFRQFDIFSSDKNPSQWGQGSPGQGILTEGEGFGQLTSLHELVEISYF
jgi:hypothetical protein